MLMGLIQGSQAGGGGAYTGPGDITAFTFWCGLRAYSAATAGTAAIRIVDSSGLNPTDINTLANGTLDSSTLATWIGAHGTASVTKWYDKVSTNDLVQATVANMPVITANALNTSYGITFTAASTTQLISGSTVTASQPVSAVTVVQPTNTTGAKDFFSIIDASYLNGVLGEKNGTNLRMYAGSNADKAMTVAWHAVQMIFNGASSLSAIDGSESTVSAGAQNISAQQIYVGNSKPGAPMDGMMMEFGFIAGTITSGNRTSLNSNMHAAYGSW